MIIMIVAALGVNAQTAQELEFAKANKYYAEAVYDSAIIVYENILNVEGYESAPLLYNIGNAYFRMRNYPMAILNYEKALKLDPSNDEIKQNLELTNALINDKIDAVPEFFLTKVWKNIGNKSSADGWAIISLILFGVFLILLFFYFTARTVFVKKTSFFGGILLFVLLICSVIMASQKHEYLSQHNEAIVIIPTINAKSAPSSSGQDLFVLHEGTKMEIISSSDGWDRIKIADGNIGWLPTSASIKY